MILAILYSCFFLLGAIVSFVVLEASRINDFFKQGKVFQIRLAYIVISLVVAHVFGSIAYRIGTFIIK